MISPDTVVLTPSRGRAVSLPSLETIGLSKRVQALPSASDAAVLAAMTQNSRLLSHDDARSGLASDLR